MAEDDTVVAEGLRQTLEQMGHRVPAVDHRGAAAREAREQDVELAVLDIRMPGGLDGIDMGERLARELEIPVIYVTAYTDDGTVLRATGTGPPATS